MTRDVDVLLEIGPKGKRVVASAMDWPGLERWGRTEGEAIEKLFVYVPRYAPVAERVGLRAEFERQTSRTSWSARRATPRPTGGASPTCRA